MPKTRPARERTDFGRRMLAARKAAGLTQEQACKAVECSQGTLAELEATAKSSGMTAQFAALYRVDAVWLANGPGVQPIPAIQARHAEPPAPPRDFEDRHLVSDSDWALLQDIKLLPPHELTAIRERLTQIRQIVDEEVEKRMRAAKGTT